MKLHRRHRIAKSENDREYLIETNPEYNYFKVRRLVWRFAKGTWKAFKAGFQTTFNNQSYCMAVEPTTIATTILEYQARKRDHQ